LLDGDWASNALSWQWVSGANANKKYYANQDNINRYFHCNQKQTYLDIDYNHLIGLPVPDELKKSIPFELKTHLPHIETPDLEINKKTLIYNYYNLDPYWHKDEPFQRVLLLEPSFFRRFPVQEKCINFVMKLGDNIVDLKIFVGEFHELEEIIDDNNIIYKEHPTSNHYKGTKESRDWIFDVRGYYSSFFAFWKKCKKQIGR
jgi:deoxyribodipyrimidine photo-lyase